MSNNPYNPYDAREIAELSTLVNTADTNERARQTILERLGFARQRGERHSSIQVGWLARLVDRVQAWFPEQQSSAIKVRALVWIIAFVGGYSLFWLTHPVNPDYPEPLFAWWALGGGLLACIVAVLVVPSHYWLSGWILVCLSGGYLWGRPDLALLLWTTLFRAPLSYVLIVICLVSIGASVADAKNLVVRKAVQVSLLALVGGLLVAQLISEGSSTSPIAAAANVGTISLMMVVLWNGYRQWELAEKNRNVDDAVKRKELANKMIVDNAIILLPYVGNVFDGTRRYTESLLKREDRIKVQMYVFTEIDNLEFVFDKARVGLIQTEYVLRAVKIFLARCGNDCFEREARRLVPMGRYNRQFVECVETLLDIGHWERNYFHRSQELPSPALLTTQ